jgi:hypothetical protein
MSLGRGLGDGGGGRKGRGMGCATGIAGCLDEPSSLGRHMTEAPEGVMG